MDESVVQKPKTLNDTCIGFMVGFPIGVIVGIVTVLIFMDKFHVG